VLDIDAYICGQFGVLREHAAFDIFESTAVERLE
jgi:hypothetical protein